MNYHLMSEEEDKGFQEGRRLAEYLEENPCKHGRKNTTCPDCIAAAVEDVENDMRNEARKVIAEMRRRHEAFGEDSSI